MGLTLVATPIGHKDDISLRAIEKLKAADLIIGEEFKEVSKLLKSLQIEKKELRVLNEHSKIEDVEELTLECKTKNVVLVSDCGTPGFCDPGFQLVKDCRKKQIAITSAPGASSLMTILSLSSERIYDFYFRGFLPAESDARNQALKNLSETSAPTIIMDTPYRLIKTLTELQKFIPNKQILLGINLTQENEKVFEGSAENCLWKLNNAQIEKAEFILLIYQSSQVKYSTASTSASSTQFVPLNSHKPKEDSQHQFKNRTQSHTQSQSQSKSQGKVDSHSKSKTQSHSRDNKKKDPFQQQSSFKKRSSGFKKK